MHKKPPGREKAHQVVLRQYFFLMMVNIFVTQGVLLVTDIHLKIRFNSQI